MLTVSPSQLSTFKDCQRQWRFRYGEKLRPRDQGRSPTLASGSAVHHVIETICRDFPQTVPKVDDVRVRAEDFLAVEFESKGNAATLVKKFLPGVVRAIDKVPEEVWLREWKVEWEIEAVIGDIILTGRPDMFRTYTSDEGIPTLEVLDAKTTETLPLEFLLWTPQIRQYALIFQKNYPNHLITYRYMCLPTQGVKPAAQSPVWPFTKKQMEVVEADVLKLASLFDPAKDEPRYSRNCSYCDYKSICMSIIAGRGEEIKTELFYVN